MPTSKDKELEDFIANEINTPLPEARASVTYNMTSPKGFGVLFTMRSGNEAELMEMMEETEEYLVKKGYTAEVRRSFGAKPKEIVEGEKCPKCGADLIKITAKGRPAVKCSMSKYDFMTKTASGCDYFKYTDISSEPATPKQEELLKEKNLWEEGMSKEKATETISRVLGK